MIRAVMNNKLDEAKTIQYKLLDGMDLLFAENNPAGVKCFLAEMGMIENILRLPLVPLSAGVHQKIKNFLSMNK